MITSQPALARIALGSILVALLVLALKLMAWRLTGSVALYSDALESIINVATASIVWQAVRIGARPADDDHPFGHHKAEYFSAVICGVLIVLAALLILREAGLALMSSSVPRIDGPGVALAGLASLVNFVWARYLIRQSVRLRSPALAADGRHVMSDVWTSLGALAGLGAVFVTGWHSLDAAIAILVGLNILREGSTVIRGSVDGLMDKALDEEESACIHSTILANADGAIEVHDLRTRSAGTVRFAEFHLVVDGEMSVAESHRICDRLERALQETLPGLEVIIHIEPGWERKEHALQIE